MNLILVTLLGFLTFAACVPVEKTSDVSSIHAIENMGNDDSALDLMPSEFKFHFYEKILEKMFKKCLKKGGCQYGGYGYDDDYYGYGGYGYGGYGGYSGYSGYSGYNGYNGYGYGR